MVDCGYWSQDPRGPGDMSSDDFDYEEAWTKLRKRVKEAICHLDDDNPKESLSVLKKSLKETEWDF